MNERYTVNLINEVQPGYTFEYAMQQLLERVQLSETQINKILSSPSYTVVKTADRGLADKVARMIQNTGFTATIATAPPVVESEESPAVTKSEEAVAADIQPLLSRLKSLSKPLLTAVTILTLLIATYLLSALLKQPTLEDAADHALDHLLLSDHRVAPDLYTDFARERIQACFKRRVTSWDPIHYERYTQAIAQLYQRDGNRPPFETLLNQYPRINSALIAAKACPKEFLLN